jgi:hypothetical protein
MAEGCDKKWEREGFIMLAPAKSETRVKGNICDVFVMLFGQELVLAALANQPSP